MENYYKLMAEARSAAIDAEVQDALDNQTELDRKIQKVQDKTVEKAWFLEQQIIESRLYVEL